MVNENLWLIRADIVMGLLNYREYGIRDLTGAFLVIFPHRVGQNNQKNTLIPN